MSRRGLARALDVAGALEAILRMRGRARTPWLTVLTYHRVHDDPKGQPFDSGVIDATSAEFDAQVGMLRHYFDVIGLEDVVRFLAGGRLPKNPALITFDDGYLDCHRTALPILKKHGAKAAFFIATSFLNERRVFWWDRIAYAIRASRRERVQIHYPWQLELDLAVSRPRATRALLDIVKHHYGLDVLRFVDELTEACGVEWNRDLERRFADDLLMTWDQVRDLRKQGMEIHSHTRTHRILQTVPVSELAAELRGARRDLEDQLGEPIRAVSYPVGRSVNRHPAIRSAVRDAGYDLGFSNTSGVTWTNGRIDPLDIRRISVEHPLPLSTFRAFLALPPFAESVCD
jgi:peptidoglycan/xylan/chitin deacetylase (PgdA/CDA1 family)